MPVIKAAPRRFPKLKDGTLEWQELSRSTDDQDAGASVFQCSMRLSGASVEPVLACPNPRCRDGGFEVGFVVESMVSETAEEKLGVLVCIGWEREGDSRESRSPCTRAIRYRMRLSYRKAVHRTITGEENGKDETS